MRFRPKIQPRQGISPEVFILPHIGRSATPLAEIRSEHCSLSGRSIDLVWLWVVEFAGLVRASRPPETGTVPRYADVGS